VQVREFESLMYKRDGRWKGALLKDSDVSAKRFTTATNLIGQLFSGCSLLCC
jgi:hypothetical protein